MNESAPAAAPDSGAEKPATKKDESSFAAFLVKLVIAVVLFRTLLFTSFSIPSESMMPRLLVGDFLFASKWSYGYSGASLPIDWDSGKGKIFGSLPERGDVVIFKHPLDRTDYVKRVIGLPGDTIQMVGGRAPGQQPDLPAVSHVAQTGVPPAAPVAAPTPQPGIYTAPPAQPAPAPQPGIYTAPPVAYPAPPAAEAAAPDS